MEYPEIVLTPADPTSIAHELAHQWFYSIVGDDEWSEPWLDESFAEFTAARLPPREVPNRLRGCRIPSAADTPLDATMARVARVGGRYVRVVYVGGGCTLRAFQRALGPAVFDAFMRGSSPRIATGSRRRPTSSRRSAPRPRGTRPSSGCCGAPASPADPASTRARPSTLRAWCPARRLAGPRASADGSARRGWDRLAGRRPGAGARDPAGRIWDVPRPLLAPLPAGTPSRDENSPLFGDLSSRDATSSAERHRRRPSFPRCFGSRYAYGHHGGTAASTRTDSAPVSLAEPSADAEGRPHDTARAIAWTALVVLPLAGLSSCSPRPTPTCAGRTTPAHFWLVARHAVASAVLAYATGEAARAPRRRAPVPGLARLPGRGRLPRAARAGHAEVLLDAPNAGLRPRHAGRAARRGVRRARGAGRASAPAEIVTRNRAAARRPHRAHGASGRSLSLAARRRRSTTRPRPSPARRR